MRLMPPIIVNNPVLFIDIAVAGEYKSVDNTPDYNATMPLMKS